jgi:hypothetical protein
VGAMIAFRRQEARWSSSQWHESDEQATSDEASASCLVDLMSFKSFEMPKRMQSIVSHRSQPFKGRADYTRCPECQSVTGLQLMSCRWLSSLHYETPARCNIHPIAIAISTSQVRLPACPLVSHSLSLVDPRRMPLRSPRLLLAAAWTWDHDPCRLAVVLSSPAQALMTDHALL